MANSANSQEKVRQENIEATVSKTELFLNNNKKTIWGVIGALVIAGALILGYQKFINEPRKAEAMQQAYPAEMYFAQGDFDHAFNGDGNSLGFEEIAQEYGAKSGKAVYFYAGVCCLQLGNYEEAVSYLKKYNGKDPILAARAKACLGDAYIELDDYSKALQCFLAAAKSSDNAFAAGYLQKAAEVYIHEGQNDKAIACFETIKDKYPQSSEAFEADRFIKMLNAQAE